MTLLVVATSPVGRFTRVERPLSPDALSDLLDELQHRGQGYVEVHDARAAWPMLAVGLSGDRAVIHLFESADSVSLLQESGPTPGAAIDVLIMDEIATFDGSFAVSVETARVVVQHFARGSIPDGLVWHRL
jgi:hypothetical protein